MLSSGEIADSSPAISALSARKSVNHSLEWKDLAIIVEGLEGAMPAEQGTARSAEPVLGAAPT